MSDLGVISIGRYAFRSPNGRMGQQFIAINAQNWIIFANVAHQIRAEKKIEHAVEMHHRGNGENDTRKKE